MLDKKYALQYKMPHTLLHIVDNSAYNAPLPQDVAEDPSLYSSIVVTATPMGIDNKIINLTRADVAAASFGLGDITADDVKRYGQSVEYPLSLIQNANAPVQLMRVTPDGSTYALTTILVQWRVEDTDPIEAKRRMVVRFKATSTLPEGLRLDRFKNTEKLNAEIVKRTATTYPEDGLTWNQAVFMNVISAGRGSAYNNFAFAINFGKQSRMPSNCRYIFSTINTNTGLTVEEFAASLSNVTTSSSNKYYSTLDDVNTVVSRRVDGSSILVPYLNQNAVKKVYADYTNMLKTFENDGVISDYEIKLAKTLNINIFDMIYGNYIYEGSQYDIKLPRYYVEMFDPDIKQLPERDRFTIFDNSYENSDMYPVQNALYPIATGTIADGSSVYIGDTYTYSTYMNIEPTIDVVTTINQYTGAITSVSYTKVLVREYDNGNVTDPVSKKLAAIIPDVNLAEKLYDDASDDAYVKLTTKPDNWDGDTPTYSNYFIRKIDGTFDSVVPEFKTDKIYDAAGAETPVASKPADWDTAYGDYFYKENAADTGVAVTTSIKELAPEWVADKYYEYVSGGALINAFNTPALNRLIASGYIEKPKTDAPAGTVVNSAVAFRLNDGTIDIATVAIDSTGKLVKVILNSNPRDVLNVIDFSERQNTGSIFAWKDGDDAFSKPGCACIKQSEAGSSVTVNGYNVATTTDIGGAVTKTGLELLVTKEKRTNKYGVVPDSVNVESEILGHQYDVIVYADNDTTKTIVNQGKTCLTYLYQPTDSYRPFGSTVATYFTNNNFTETEGRQINVGTYIGFINNEASAAAGPKGKLVARIEAIDVVDNVKKIRAITIVDSDFYFNRDSAVNYFKALENVKMYYIGTIDGTPVTDLNPININIDIKHLCATDVVLVDRVAGNETHNAVTPDNIIRYTVTGSTGSLIRPQLESDSIPENYYLDNFGINPSSAAGGVKLTRGSTGFFDDPDISDIEFKWRYAELLVKAFRGEIDPRIMSPVRCPAKFLFDGAFNTIVGQSILPNVKYNPTDIVNSATMYTEEEREEVLYNPNLMSFVQTYDVTNDIDVKQAMYDLMIYRCYYGLPEDKRPIGPGFGLSVHFDSGVTDFTTAQMVNESFKRRFDNPNASWDIGGYTSTNGITYTYTKWIVDHLIEHCKNQTINKPFVMSYATIPNSEYTSFYPDLDVTDWDLRELLYESGGNAWVPDINGNLVRRSQRTMFYANDTSDLLQESNMRTLSQLCYLLQNMIEGCLYSYTDDGVLQTMTDMCKNRFSAWPGNLVDTLDISFERDINPTDGGDIVVCYCNVSFRGLFLRVPIIVNVNRRAQ